MTPYLSIYPFLILAPAEVFFAFYPARKAATSFRSKGCGMNKS